MDVKWFFVIVGIFLTFSILVGMYFIGNYIALQSQSNADRQLSASEGNFNRSVLIHDALYNNITDLKKGLDPILAVIPNATQAEQERQLHYNQTTSDFDTIKRILEIKLQDHDTLGKINQSLAVIAEGMNYSDIGDNMTIPKPIPQPPIIDCEKNDTTIPVIENITGEKTNLTTNSLHQC